MAERDGGPAFPERYDYVNDPSQSWGGMTLRQWYAGMAMQGMLASEGTDGQSWGEPSRMAAHAFVLADAMLAHEAGDD